MVNEYTEIYNPSTGTYGPGNLGSGVPYNAPVTPAPVVQQQVQQLGDQYYGLSASEAAYRRSNEAAGTVPASADLQARADAEFKASQLADSTFKGKEVYSQYWMNPAYTGPEPSIEEKAILSTADYAQAFAGAMSSLHADAGGAVTTTIQGLADWYKSVGGKASQNAAGDVTTNIIAPYTLSTSLTTPGSGGGGSQQLSDITGQLTGIASALLKWLSDNLLIVIVVVAGAFLVPRLLAAGTGRRTR
jgi:hypothetical protein